MIERNSSHQHTYTLISLAVKQKKLDNNFTLSSPSPFIKSFMFRIKSTCPSPISSVTCFITQNYLIL